MTTTIRDAKTADIGAVVAMGRKFFAVTDYANFSDYSDEAARKLCEMMHGSGVLLVAEVDDRLVGMVGLVVTPFMFNHAAKMAYEVMWWVDPAEQGRGVGKALLEAVEPACRSKGAVAIQMIHLASSPAQAGALYERMGYQLSEHSFMKEI